MRKVVFLVLFYLSFLSAKAQYYDIGLHTGLFTPIDFWYYVGGEIGPQAGLSFKYHFDDRLALSSNYLRGGFGYSPALSELRINGQRSGPEYTRVNVDIFSFIFHRKFALKNDWIISIGTGFGYYLENRNERPVSIPDTNRQIFYRRDFTMPWNLNASKEIAPNIIFGINSGVFLTPFYRLGGFHLGPSISYRL